MTNREKINKKTNEELAEIISGCEFCSNQNHLGTCGLRVEPLREDCIRGKTEWLSQEAELTADEMFEKLGYIKEGKFNGCIAYWNDKYKRRITINWNDEYEKATDFEYQKSVKGNFVVDTITEDEDKAIHKKIEELKCI